MLYEALNMDVEDKGQEILQASLKAPFKQIVENAGKMYPATVGNFGQGYNVKTGEYGDMYKMGVIDPAKVTKNALKNAVSVATTILTTNAIVTLKR